ncbi:SulP family inorganic anion transporter [Streptomyces sp. NPDC059247]|uniref:SulP family inorganic anion transporter n=1 Tax=Streptomyces sp. NPDC059247 TaxID=3346790 RepID=UPI0036CC28EE
MSVRLKRLGRPTVSDASSGAVTGLFSIPEGMAYAAIAGFNPVMTGFSTGIALQIITGVLKDATGFEPQGHNKLYQLGDWLVHVGDWKGAATLVAVATVAVWAATRAVKRLAPVALLVAMVVVSVGVAVLSVDVELVRDIASIPGSLPSFTAPDLAAVPGLAWGAVSVALVALAQAAGTGGSLPRPNAVCTAVRTSAKSSKCRPRRTWR